MERLSLTFYLGTALEPVAAGVATAMSERLGIPVDFERGADPLARRAALDRPAPGIAWGW